MPEYKDDETIIDDTGAWRRFAVEYVFCGRYALEVYARSFEEAEARLKAIGSNGMVLGVIEGEMDAGEEQ